MGPATNVPRTAQDSLQIPAPAQHWPRWPAAIQRYRGRDMAHVPGHRALYRGVHSLCLSLLPGVANPGRGAGRSGRRCILAVAGVLSAWQALVPLLLLFLLLPLRCLRLFFLVLMLLLV